MWRALGPRLAQGARQCASSTQQVARQHQLDVALVLERIPVIVPLSPEWELEHDKWQEEVQRRHYRHLPEFWADYDRRKGDDASGGRGWQPAPRITEADEKRDTKSLNRCLDQRLYFVVRAQGQPWSFPRRPHQQGETTRSAAERVLAEEGQTQGKTFEVFYLGNGPAGHCSIADRPVYFHRAQLIKGSLLLSNRTQHTEYAWLNKQELLEEPVEADVRALLEGML